MTARGWAECREWTRRRTAPIADHDATYGAVLDAVRESRAPSLLDVVDETLAKLRRDPEREPARGLVLCPGCGGVRGPVFCDTCADAGEVTPAVADEYLAGRVECPACLAVPSVVPCNWCGGARYIEPCAADRIRRHARHAWPADRPGRLRLAVDDDEEGAL